MEKIILPYFPTHEFVCFFTIIHFRFGYLCRMFMRYFLIALLLYFVIRFIFRFVLPVAKATKEMKGKMDEFKNRMEEQQQQGASANQKNTQPTSQPKGGDYIDFEEIN